MAGIVAVITNFLIVAGSIGALYNQVIKGWDPTVLLLWCIFFAVQIGRWENSQGR